VKCAQIAQKGCAFVVQQTRCVQPFLLDFRTGFMKKGLFFHKSVDFFKSKKSIDKNCKNVKIPINENPEHQ
jgi:hypothetical protein